MSLIKPDDCSQLAKGLKDLPYRVQTASIPERKEVIDNVVAVLTNPGKTSPLAQYTRTFRGCYQLKRSQASTKTSSKASAKLSRARC